LGAVVDNFPLDGDEVGIRIGRIGSRFYFLQVAQSVAIAVDELIGATELLLLLKVESIAIVIHIEPGGVGPDFSGSATEADEATLWMVDQRKVQGLGHSFAFSLEEVSNEVADDRLLAQVEQVDVKRAVGFVEEGDLQKKVVREGRSQLQKQFAASLRFFAVDLPPAVGVEVFAGSWFSGKKITGFGMSRLESLLHEGLVLNRQERKKLGRFA